MILRNLSIQDDFTNGIDFAMLDQEIKDAGCIDNFIGLTGSVELDDLEIHGDAVNDDPALDAVIAAHDPANAPLPFRVESLVTEEFKDFPVENIDFTIHLMKDIVLDKAIVMLPNGRPQHADYRYNGDLIARIEWEFTDNPGGLYVLKELYLSYYRTDDSLGDRFIIKRRSIDLTNPTELNISIQERIDARASIVGEIKGACSGALQVALGQTLEQVVATITPFWDEYRVQREHFIELGTKQWRDDLAALDITTNHTWLQTPMDANGTTCRDYMVFRMSY